MNVLARSPRAALAAAFAAGALAVAGFAPLSFWPLPFVSAAYLFALWQGAATPRAAFLAGLAFGAGLFGAGASWVYVSLHDFGMMPASLAALATFLFCAGLALFPAAAGWCFARLAPAHGMAAALAFSALWMLAEWLRGWFLTGFPWLALGYSQTDSPLAGFAPVLGVFGVSFAAALCAALLYLLFSGPARNRIAAALAIALVFGLGQFLRQIEWTSPQGEPLRVALLQGNIPQDLKFQAERYTRTLATYRRLIDAAQAQLIVLPETAIPRFLDSVDPSYLEDIARIARERRADLIIGAPLRDAGRRYFNSIISLGVSPSQRYDKSHLVPFGEFVPPGFGWIVRILSIPFPDFSRGPDNPQPLALAGQLVAPNICYEDAFGGEIIRQLPQATLLVNVSNVAWFGDSLAPGQHLQIARMRALESGRFMLRATNTGMTATIDARGNVIAQLPQFTEGMLTADVQGRSGATPYVRFGNAPIVLLCALVLAVLAQRRRHGIGRPVESR